MIDRPTILFFITEDWYLCSHRLDLVKAAVATGMRAVVVTRVHEHAKQIEATGAQLIPLEMSRRSRAVRGELTTLRHLIAIYRDVRPDLCHHVALKPVLYGSLVARLTGVPAVVNALGGLGYLFISRRFGARALRQPVKLAFRALLAGRGRRVIVQNRDDRALLRRNAGLPRRVFALIAGSGVDPDRYPFLPEPDGPVRVAVVARMLWDKGIDEVVTAARLLRAWGHDIQVTLVGAPDPENPATIPEKVLAAWRTEGLVDHLGHCEDIPGVWREHHLSVLTSYREGLPLSLLESASCGRAMIASDVPGCRDVVRHGQTGLLVPVRDPRALAEAIVELARDHELRRTMGKRARRMVEQEYTVKHVVDRTLAVYRELLGEI
jgi:glycosyltransferase involved in cell wall biosynthesis